MENVFAIRIENLDIKKDLFFKIGLGYDKQIFLLPALTKNNLKKSWLASSNLCIHEIVDFA